jgi:hypothetical protein
MEGDAQNSSNNQNNISDLTTEEIIQRIRRDRVALDGKFDDSITYKQLVEEDIVKLLGFTTLSAERQQKFREMVGGMLENRVAVRILDSLSDEDRNEYITLIDSGNNQEATDCLAKKGIDPLEILTIESIMLKTELYLDSKTVKNSAQEEFDKSHNGRGEDESSR